jgi:putative DNA primase/helicase
MSKTYSKLQSVLLELRNQAKRIKPPTPNEVESKFVMECLALESEGDGILFAHILKDKLLYATSRESWFVWQENIWMRDNIYMVMGLTRYLTDRYGLEIIEFEKKIDESKKKNDSEDHKTYAKIWNKKIEGLMSKIKALRQEKGRNAAIKFSHTFFENPFAIEGTEFDKNPWYLGVQNGVVDLRSGNLLPGSPEQLVSKQCSCAYDPDINTDDWLLFLSTIYNNDLELVEFVQTLFGYAATGETSEHVFPFFLGKGRNGKSLLLAAIMRVLADYAAVIPCELFLKTNQPKNTAQADPAVMKLEGLRLAVSSEVEEGSRFSAKNVKTYTGGDTLEGRNPYDKEQRNFEPSHLVAMIGNHEPVPPSGDPAFWDRTYLINHPVRFVKHEPESEFEKPADPDIEEKLKGMDQQILSWLVEGALKWRSNGKELKPPESVLKATEDYKEDADWVGQFLGECCVMDPDSITGSTGLYAAFVIWYREKINAKKTFTPTQRAFGLKLKARDGVEHKRKTNGVKYIGLHLNDEWEERMLRAATGKSDELNDVP